MSNNNSFKIIFKDENEQPTLISMVGTIKTLNDYITADMIQVLLSGKEIAKIVYPSGLPKNRLPLIGIMRGMVNHLKEVKIEESKVVTWDGQGAVGARIDFDIFMSESYLTMRGFNMESEKDLEVAEEIFELMEDTKKRLKELKNKAESKILIPAFHYHSFESVKR